MQSTPKEIYELIQLSTAGKDAEIAEKNAEIAGLRMALNNKNEEIERLRALNEALKIIPKSDPDEWVKERSKEEGMRYILEKIITYAEKLPERRINEAIAIQTVLLLLSSEREMPDGVITDELDERLRNIAIQEVQKTPSQVYVSGGMAILGGQFEKTDFVAQKKIESK